MSSFTHEVSKHEVVSSFLSFDKSRQRKVPNAAV
jgi:hypothetical protein